MIGNIILAIAIWCGNPDIAPNGHKIQSPMTVVQVNQCRHTLLDCVTERVGYTEPQLAKECFRKVDMPSNEKTK